MTAQKRKCRSTRTLASTKRHRCTKPGCDKAFTRLSHLQRHALNHSETHWVCSRCNAPFKRLDLLERHKARHLAKDSLAGGSGLGMLQTRRKHVSGAFLSADVSGSKALLHNSKDTASSDHSSDTIGSLNEQSTPAAQQDGTANHIGENLPEPPVSIFDGELSAIRSPSMNLCELGNIYYDTSFDSVHFDVMGLACSPPQIAYESHGSSPSPLEPQAPLFRQRSRSVNFEAIQSPLSSITVEEPENHRQSRFQRPNGSPLAVLSNSAHLPLRAYGLQKRGLEVPKRLDGITTERRVEGDNVYTPREEWDLELLPVKRHEILDLLAEIRPIYPNGSPVDGDVAELSRDAMQEYIDLFLRYFNTSYPMVHIPTLDITNAEPILLLSMITLGATYKNKVSHQVSVCLYDAIVPYILSGLMSIPIPDLSTLQAFLILECYGMYRAGPYQQEKAMLIHTLLFSAIRRVSRYHVCGGIMLPSHLTHHEAGWREFAYAEQYKRYRPILYLLIIKWHIAQIPRLILFVFMWDTQNVSCYSFMPSMSTHTIQVPLPCAPEMWSASTEPIWRRVKGSYPKPLNFNEMVKLLIEDGEAMHANHPLDGLSLTLILHGLMSMCNDMVHFDNRSICLSDVEKDEISWKPWRKRMIHALETWKACYDIYIMTTLQGMQDQKDPCMYANHQAESVTLLALYHVAHVVINCEIRHLQAAAGMKAIFGHIVTSADRVESTQWVKQWVTTHAAAADHAAWHAAQMFREGLLYLKKWDAKGEFHYPWCFVIGTLTCWAFHRFGGEDMQPSLCAHRRGAEMTQEQSQALMNQLVSLMASVSTADVRRTLQKCCTHGLSREVARYLKNVRWTAAFEAMKLLEGLSEADSL